MSDARSAVEGYFAAINADAFEDLRAVFTDDVEIRTVGSEPVIGLDAAVAHFGAVLSGYPAHLDDVTRWIVTEDAIVVTIAFTGTTADGRSIAFDALDVFDLRDGRIARVTTWYDTSLVARLVRGS